MRRPKQQSLFKAPRKNTKLWWIRERSTYGGSMNYRKVKRPFDSKKLVHIVLKAHKNEFPFTRSKKAIQKLIQKIGQRYNINIKDLAINHDHLHLLVGAKSRESFLNFLRLIAAELGRQYQAIYKRFKIKRTKILWKTRPFTRLLAWGTKSIRRVQNYFERNRNEAAGFISYTPRKHRLSLFLTKWEKQMRTLESSA